MVSASLSSIRRISPAGFVGFTAEPQLVFLLAMFLPSIGGRLISHKGSLNRSYRDSQRRDPWCLFHHYPFSSAVTQINPSGEATKLGGGCVTRRRNMLRACDAHMGAETLLHRLRRRCARETGTGDKWRGGGSSSINAAQMGVNPLLPTPPPPPCDYCSFFFFLLSPCSLSATLSSSR